MIGIFITLCSLFLFVFAGSYNILDNGFADLKPFFDLAPWIFIFLIPAVTMKSFAEENKQGTLELLLTRPISSGNLVIGKFLGALSISVLAIIPTLIYVYTVYSLGSPTGNLDVGATIGSYIGLLLLASSYTAIGVFASSLSHNQITAFIIAVFLCFLMFFAFEGIADLKFIGDSTYGFEYLGMRYHYKSMSRGVLDTRDLIYFFSFILVFIYITYFKVQSNKIKV